MVLKLFKYQQEIVNRAPNKGYALFMEAGTGKTVTALEIVRKWGCHKLLVICLANKVSDWIHDTNMQDIGINLIKATKSEDDSDGYAVSFESCWRREWLLKWVDSDTAIIVDESHKIKNWRSKVGKFCNKLRTKTKYKLILTGTPQSKKYIDYFNQMKFIGAQPFVSTVGIFKRNYCIEDTVWFSGYPVKQIAGYKHCKELDDGIHDNSVVFKRELQSDLIPTEQIIKTKRPSKYLKLMRERVLGDKIYDTVPALMMGLRELIAESKKSRLATLLDECEGERIVIFYTYNFERDMIIYSLSHKNIQFSEYNGRKKDLENFKNRDDGVAVVNIGSGSTGLNDFVLAHIMIFYSLPREYIQFVQAKKRIDRIGQTSKPLYYFMISQQTFEEKQLKTLKEGQDFDEKILF